MRNVYQKTFWKNEHQLEVAIPLEEWPRKAKFLTVDKNGSAKFWTVKPYYGEHFDWCNGGGELIDEEKLGIIGGAHSIWERSY